ncbi:MAG TPA: protealysin inhibitor emfourin [Capillimicrobium sp.]|nr:protealysin inhibitor emfourin [Capillimicrobium sp.]
MIRALAAALAATALLAAPASAVRLVVDRTGGFAGVRDHLVLRADGTAWRTDRTAARAELDRADTAHLRRALRAARFATLRPTYAPEGPVADAFEYRFRHRGHEVTVVDAVTAMPKRLRALLDTASAALSAGAPAR